jgi:aminoglycoside 6'-N-acetyltransferase I
MEIETLSECNLKPLIGLVLELWNDCEFEEEYEAYKSIIEIENEICYLAKNQGEYIAFIHLTIRHDYVEGAIELPVAYVEGIYVKTEFQKRGLAKELMKTAENWALQKGLKQLASDTELTNAAGINFHQKLGFTEVDRLVCFIKNLDEK